MLQSTVLSITLPVISNVNMSPAVAKNTEEKTLYFLSFKIAHVLAEVTNCPIYLQIGRDPGLAISQIITDSSGRLLAMPLSSQCSEDIELCLVYNS